MAHGKRDKVGFPYIIIPRADRHVEWKVQATETTIVISWNDRGRVTHYEMTLDNARRFAGAVNQAAKHIEAKLVLKAGEIAGVL